jgi:ankyrin repeat protein
VARIFPILPILKQRGGRNVGEIIFLGVKRVYTRLFFSKTSKMAPLFILIASLCFAWMPISLAVSESAQLFSAAINGDLPMVKKLLADHVSPNIRNEHQATPLHLAVLNQHPTIVSALLNAHNINPNLEDGNGDTPIRLAIQLDNRESIGLLLRANVDVYLQDVELALNPQIKEILLGYRKWAKSAVHKAGSHFESLINIVDQYGKTQLNWAAFRGDFEMTQALLGAGATVHQNDINLARNNEIRELLKQHQNKN